MREALLLDLLLGDGGIICVGSVYFVVAKGATAMMGFGLCWGVTNIAKVL